MKDLEIAYGSEDEGESADLDLLADADSARQRGERSVWTLRCGSDEATGLATPPSDGRGFVQFSAAVMRSPRILAVPEGSALRQP